jgi:hypothetical protein
LSLKKNREVKKTVVILLFLYEKIFPDIENMRSTAADEALTERYYSTKPAWKMEKCYYVVSRILHFLI